MPFHTPKGLRWVRAIIKERRDGMIKKLSTGERRCQQTNVTERVRSDELARLDHDKGDIPHLLVFLLRMALEEFERFLFAYVASFHKYALGPLDEFSRLDGLAHLREVFPEFTELLEPRYGEPYGRKQLLFRDRLKQKTAPP